MHLLREIELFMKARKMPPTKFGRLAARDPRLVLDMRNGREPRAAMENKVRAFIQSEMQQLENICGGNDHAA